MFSGPLCKVLAGVKSQKLQGNRSAFYPDASECVGGFDLMSQQLLPNSTGLFRALGRLAWGVWDNVGLRETLPYPVLAYSLLGSLVYLR